MPDDSLQLYPLWPTLRADMLLGLVYPEAPIPHYVSLGQLKSYLGDGGGVGLDSPAFTGTPTAPTPPSGDDSTRLATTEWVQIELGDLVLGGGGIPEAPTDGQIYGRGSEAWSLVLPLAGGTLTGALTLSPTTGFSTINGTNGFVINATPWGAVNGNFTFNNGLTVTGTTTLSGVSRALTPPPTDNSTSIATTEWVRSQSSGGVTVSDTAPASPSVGQLWLDGVSMQLYCWVNDGSSSQWIVCNNPQSAAKAYTVGFSYIGGTLGASQLIGLHKFSRAVSFAANFAGYSGAVPEAGATATATASTVIAVERALAASPNAFSGVGTITFAAGTITPTFTTSGGTAVAFVQGDVLRLIGPATPDATFANPYVTLVGQES